MKGGQVVASGSPADVLTPQLLADVFNLPALVILDPATGTPLVVPLPRLPAQASSGRRLRTSATALCAVRRLAHDVDPSRL